MLSVIFMKPVHAADQELLRCKPNSSSDRSLAIMLVMDRLHLRTASGYTIRLRGDLARWLLVHRR